MSKVDVFNHGWIDLVFEGRNQEYGAYQLRKQDSKTTMIALFGGIAFLGTVSAIPVAISYFSPAEIIVPSDEIPATEIILSKDDLFDMPKDEPKEKITPEPAVAAQPAPPANNVVQFRNELVATSTPVPDPPTIDQFKEADPGQANIQGAGTLGSLTNTTTPGVIGGKDNVTTPDIGNGFETTASVDKMPTFPGGLKDFLTAVGRNYRVPEADEAQTVRVLVWFIVEKDGSITDIKVTRDPKPELGLGKEAIRALERIKTKWTPGEKNGKPVRTAYSLPITVNIH
jgi:protein TonB